MSFRFEAHENVVTKHHLGKKIHWTQAARCEFMKHLSNPKVTICSVKQLDEDTVEILKRFDKKHGFSYKYFGSDQKGFYERVTINRKTATVASDRLDVNWWHDKPFIGRRHTFYIENREGNNSQNGSLAFVSHHFWLHALKKPLYQLHTNLAAWKLKRAFAATPSAAAL